MKLGKLVETHTHPSSKYSSTWLSTLKTVMRPQWCPNQPRRSLKSRVHGCPDNAWAVVQIYTHYPLCKVLRRKSNLVLNWYYFPKQENRMIRALWGGYLGSTGRQLTTPPTPRPGLELAFTLAHSFQGHTKTWEPFSSEKFTLCVAGTVTYTLKNGKSERKHRPAADGKASEADGREADVGWGGYPSPSCLRTPGFILITGFWDVTPDS